MTLGDLAKKLDSMDTQHQQHEADAMRRRIEREEAGAQHGHLGHFQRQILDRTSHRDLTEIPDDLDLGSGKISMLAAAGLKTKFRER